MLLRQVLTNTILIVCNFDPNKPAHIGIHQTALKSVAHDYCLLFDILSVVSRRNGVYCTNICDYIE